MVLLLLMLMLFERTDADDYELMMRRKFKGAEGSWDDDGGSFFITHS